MPSTGQALGKPSVTPPGRSPHSARSPCPAPDPHEAWGWRPPLRIHTLAWPLSRVPTVNKPPSPCLALAVCADPLDPRLPSGGHEAELTLGRASS